MVLMLAGCGSDEVAAVKQSASPHDPAYTVGGLMENRAICDSSDWETVEEEQALTKVVYTCTITDGIEPWLASKLAEYEEFQKSSSASELDWLDYEAQEMRDLKAKTERRLESAKAALAKGDLPEADYMTRSDSGRSVRNYGQNSLQDLIKHLEPQLAREEQRLKELLEERSAVEAKTEKRHQEELAEYRGLDVDKIVESYTWTVRGDNMLPEFVGSVLTAHNDGEIIETNQNFLNKSYARQMDNVQALANYDNLSDYAAEYRSWYYRFLINGPGSQDGRR